MSERTLKGCAIKELDSAAMGLAAGSLIGGSIDTADSIDVIVRVIRYLSRIVPGQWYLFMPDQVGTIRYRKYREFNILTERMLSLLSSPSLPITIPSLLAIKTEPGASEWSMDLITFAFLIPTGLVLIRLVRWSNQTTHAR